LICSMSMLSERSISKNKILLPHMRDQNDKGTFLIISTLKKHVNSSNPVGDGMYGEVTVVPNFPVSIRRASGTTLDLTYVRRNTC